MADEGAAHEAEAKLQSRRQLFMEAEHRELKSGSWTCLWEMDFSRE